MPCRALPSSCRWRRQKRCFAAHHLGMTRACRPSLTVILVMRRQGMVGLLQTLRCLAGTLLAGAWHRSALTKG
jgi:hypothetical protein